MPGSIRFMHLEHVLRDVQTDRGNLLHGRLLRWQFDTVTLAHRCRRGASTPSPDAVSCWPCRESLLGGATLSLPRAPAKVPSQSDLPTFVNGVLRTAVHGLASHLKAS